MPIYNEVEKYTVTNGGGTVNLDVTRATVTRYVFSGTATLGAGYVIQSTGTPLEGMEFAIRWQAVVTTAGANVVTVFGTVLTTAQALSDLIITVYYNGSAWDVDINEDGIQNIWEIGTGTQSFKRIGNSSLTSATGSASLGTGSTSSGQYSLTDGKTTLASSTYSHAGGLESIAGRYGQLSRSSGRLPGMGITDYGQWSKVTLSQITTDATSTELGLDGGGSFITIPPTSTVFFKGSVIAQQYAGSSGTAGDNATWYFNGTITNIGGTTALTDTVLFQDNTGAWGSSAQRSQVAAAAAWTVVVTASNVDDSLYITVTGAANKNIMWLASIELTEILLSA